MSGGPGKKGRFWVSSAYPASPGRPTIAPVEAKGYGPNVRAPHSMTSGMRAGTTALDPATRASTAVTTGRPSAVTSCLSV
ncbi:hypothetical protein EES45_15515 [Streptomyces sp. ADI97-07]|nr:hypothetical protein EES45_15515 [Streptomyces sp. ADI97-07]